MYEETSFLKKTLEDITACIQIDHCTTRRKASEQQHDEKDNAFPELTIQNLNWQKLNTALNHKIMFFL